VIHAGPGWLSPDNIQRTQHRSIFLNERHDDELERSPNRQIDKWTSLSGTSGRLLNVDPTKHSLLTIAAVASAFAASFPILLTLRMVSGIVSSGIFPAAMALAADLAPIGQRQQALSRILFAGMAGNLLGASAGGIVADLIGWAACSPRAQSECTR
jgi:MFS family permease